eukprot:TRINITY_DN114555_c0_g1_i1.p1 TRINITY_DN114555_c0_g1~~TRINITY_DN114555_c0_g1_i1.p1  ORF type:complete len:264 (-),score=62.61 TRINITY_DN114555_c0_g1_i1:229-1020(-)
MYRFGLIFAVIFGLAAGSKPKVSGHHLLAHKGKKKANSTGGGHYQELRICNAYPAELKVSVSANPLDKKLKFKECHDYREVVRPRDDVAFFDGAEKIGGFSVSEVPDFDSTLLLVIGKSKSGVDFQSHAYSADRRAEVAVVKAFEGSADKAMLSGTAIAKKDGQRVKLRKTESISVELEDNTALKVEEGNYEVKVGGDEDEFAMRAGKAYVVMRFGPSAKDMVIFPHDHSLDYVKERSGATTATTNLAGLLIAVLALSSHAFY